MQWRTEMLTLADFPIYYARPAMLKIEANGGSVEIQQLGSDGETWTAIETFTQTNSEQIAVAGTSGLRIVAKDGAKFAWRSI